MADENEDDTLEEKETRRNNRKKFKEMNEDMTDNKQEMKNVHSSKFANLLKRYEEVGKGLADPNTRELIAGASCLRQLTGAVKDQAQSLCDVSARFNWQDLSTSISNRFRNGGANGGVDWEKLGSEARFVFNATPSFTTMVGPIHKEERVRKIAVRRQRENLAGVANATSENVENDENDGNDEATNARVANLLKHLESYEKEEFDLLKTLVDPINPVQSVENFFDYSYLHKEKRVVHKFDEASGSLKACIAEPEELEKRQKKQMVLSFNMLDMKHMAKVLYPEMYESSASDDAASSSRSSGTSQGTRSSQVSHPLHREDPLYDALDAQEQVRILAERTAQQKAQKKESAGAAGAGARNTQSQRAPASQSNTRSKSNNATSSAASASQAQSSSSRRTSSGSAAASRAPPAAKVSEQNGRRNTGNDSEDEVLPNGSTSSRYGATLAAKSASAAAKGSSQAAKKSVQAERDTATGAEASATRRTSTKRQISSPVLTPTPPRPSRSAPSAAAAPIASAATTASSSTPGRSAVTPAVGTATGNSRQSTRSNTPSPSVPATATSARTGAANSAGKGSAYAVKRALEQDEEQTPTQGAAKRRTVERTEANGIASPVAQLTPARSTTGGNPALTVPLPQLGVKNLQNLQNGNKLQQGKENNKYSPDESQHTEEMFHSASDRDSQSS